MQLCDEGHDEVCYEGRNCPACQALKEGYEDGYEKGYDEGHEAGCDTVSEE